MICRYCTDPYRFIRFERQGKSLFFQAVFQCGCEEPRHLTETECRETGLLDEEELAQLKTLRLLALRDAVEERPAARPSQVYLEALAAHRKNLAAYLRDFSSIYPLTG